jgi:cell division protein FtsB
MPHTNEGEWMSGKKKFLIVMIALLVVASFVAYQFMIQLNTLRAVRAEAAAQHEILNTKQAETAQLQQDNKEAKSDSWVVQMARDILGWVLPGEVKIVDKDK